QQGALAGPVPAHYPEELALPDVERHVPQGLEPAVDDAREGMDGALLEGVDPVARDLERLADVSRLDDDFAPGWGDPAGAQPGARARWGRTPTGRRWSRRTTSRSHSGTRTWTRRWRSCAGTSRRRVGRHPG